MALTAKTYTLSEAGKLIGDSIVKVRDTSLPLGSGLQIPKKVILSGEKSGVYFGTGIQDVYGQPIITEKGYYVGRPAEAEGNVFVVGKNGSGKSRYIAKPTIRRWNYPAVYLDIKGELITYYLSLKEKGFIKGNYIIFNPVKGGYHYDPFALLDKNDKNYIVDIMSIVYAIMPISPHISDQYWIRLAQNYFGAVLAYCLYMDMDFSEAVLFLYETSSDDLFRKIRCSSCDAAKYLIKNLREIKNEQLAGITSEIDAYIRGFVTDLGSLKALSRDNYPYVFNWRDIVMAEQPVHVFLCMEQNRLEHWDGMIRMMITQLIRQLECRPDQYSPEGINMQPFLIMLDEFPLLGKIDAITSSLPTLRSRKVCYCLMVQDLAQLDKTYGSDIRKILVNNCDYKAILNITEPDEQDYFSRLFGMYESVNRSGYGIYESNGTSYLSGFQERRSLKPLVYPHEFATNDGILLQTPYGNCKTIKEVKQEKILQVKDFDLCKGNSAADSLDENVYWNFGKEAFDLKGKEMTVDAVKKEEQELHRRILKENKKGNDDKENLEVRRKVIIGEMFLKYFPSVNGIPLDLTEEDLAPLDVFIESLSKMLDGYDLFANWLCESGYVGK